MPKKKTKNLVIILIILNIFSISFFLFLFNHTNDLITESVLIENELKNEIKRDDARVFMKEDLLRAKSYEEKISGYVISKEGTVDFIKTLEQLVSSSSLKSNIKNVSNENYEKGNAIGAELMKVNVDVIGEWKNIIYFLKLLENYPLKIDIKTISLNMFSSYTVGGKIVPQWVGSFEFSIVKMKDNQ